MKSKKTPEVRQSIVVNRENQAADSSSHFLYGTRLVFRTVAVVSTII